jgi:hypothetical protein
LILDRAALLRFRRLAAACLRLSALVGTSDQFPCYSAAFTAGRAGGESAGGRPIKID